MPARAQIAATDVVEAVMGEDLEGAVQDVVAAIVRAHLRAHSENVTRSRSAASYTVISST